MKLLANPYSFYSPNSPNNKNKSSILSPTHVSPSKDSVHFSGNFTRAAKNGNVSLVDKHLTEGTNPNTANIQHGNTALHHASKYGHTPVVRRLLQHSKTNIGIKNHEHVTPLMNAAASGNIEILNMLLAKGADVAAISKNQETAAMLAAREGKPDVLEALIKKDSQLVTREGINCFLKAARKGHKDICKLLLENGLNPNSICNADRDSLSTWAAIHNMDDIAQLLLQHGANKKHANIYGETVFRNNNPATTEAAKQRFDTLMQKNDLDSCLAMLWENDLLLDVNQTDRANRTALHLAAARDAADSVGLLVGRQANVSAKDANGQTPLHHAAQFNAINAAEVLLKAGADKGLRDNYKQTPGDIACDLNHLELFEML